jgi:catechol 2,3-dioxygenase-like lactoylglutathione lyase family enzyme
MYLLDHASITVRDIEAVKPFYRAIMAALGAEVAYDDEDAIGFGERNAPSVSSHSYLSVFQSEQTMPDARRHWCFRAPSAQAVRDFHAQGLAAGGSDEGPPGLRDYHASYYAAFLLDPEGNKVEAVFHGGDRPESTGAY